MGRAPYCQKMGLKKGPWSFEEDRILIAHIQKYGHPNWCALPKVAGLLRCGRSCRLRWLNYLKPDIKRGNFSKEEEEAIINLHTMLGNRWSAIAARLPGRTDNEIKNMWHTQLKKRAALKQTMANSDDKQNSKKITHQFAESAVLSPQPYSSDFSSVTASSTGETNHYHQSTDVKDKQNLELFDHFPEIDDCFWTDAISEFAIDDGMDFWYNILLTTGGEST